MNKMRPLFAAAALAASFCIAFSPAVAGPVDSGFRSVTFPANDDGATGAVSLGFSANYFGTTYTQTFISNNGYLTFSSGQGTYTPGGLGSGYVGQPIIAAFFADVDTRAANSGLTSYGSGTYAGRQAFGATWPAVGYYNSRDDLLNTFQIILTNRSDTGAGNFDVYLNYDRIQWETGSASGGLGGFGGTSAAAGFNAGLPGNPAGTFYEFPGSRMNGALIDGGPNSLTVGTNDSVMGQYYFAVRNGTIDAPPPTRVPEPATIALFSLGLLGLGIVKRVRKA